MKVSLPYNRKTRIEMLPLIDIVFLLLVVFIYTMLSMAVHRGMSVELPSSSTAEIEKQLILSVTVEEGGDIYIDREKVELDHLTQRLASRVDSHADPGVLLFADSSVSYQRLFSVLDRIRSAGLSKISLQAEAIE